ncbi:MAG: spore coat-associated protein N [Nitriliruptoraceae bacterium]|jgi:spore coat-associated protein N
MSVATSISTATVRTGLHRRMLLPLATLLTAVSIAGVSGANFTASTSNPLTSVASGSLLMVNSRAAEGSSHIFQAGNIKPGDTVVGAVTITNSGTLPAVVSVTETATNGFADQSNLTMQVTEQVAGGEPTVVFNGIFATFGSSALGTWTAGESRTYTFRVTLNPSATNSEQLKSADATYDWNSVQTVGEIINGQA